MEKKSVRIVYMGTPDFAVQSLKSLVEGGYNVVGVITMPDKPAGRGQKLQASPVKQYATLCNIPILQPEKLKEEAFLADLRALKADLQIVVAFRMLPEVVWNMPLMGTFNLHASLLPQYRGAAPLNWAIINGEKESGATTFFLTHEIDTGKILLSIKTPINDTDCVGDLHDRLMMMGAQLVTDTVDAILAQTILPTPQATLMGDKQLQMAPKIFKEDCQINWNQPTQKVYDFIRGLSPSPTAWSKLITPEGEEQVVKIFESKQIETTPTDAPGTIITDQKTFLHVLTADGAIAIKSLQFPGKKRLSIDYVLRGKRVLGAFIKD